LIILLSNLKQDEIKERLINSAFLAHQLGAGGEQTFGEYLKNLGLTNEATPIPRKEITKEEALKIGKRIRAKAKKIKGK